MADDRVHKFGEVLGFSSKSVYYYSLKSLIRGMQSGGLETS